MMEEEIIKALLEKKVVFSLMVTGDSAKIIEILKKFVSFEKVKEKINVLVDNELRRKKIEMLARSKITNDKKKSFHEEIENLNPL